MGVFTGITNIDYTNNSFENLFTGTSKIIEKKYTPVYSFFFSTFIFLWIYFLACLSSSSYSVLKKVITINIILVFNNRIYCRKQQQKTYKNFARSGERKSVAAVVNGNLNQRQSTHSFAVNGFKRVKTVYMYK